MNLPLSPERSAQIRQLFEELFELADEKRQGFLDTVCENDHELRVELNSLLEESEKAGPRLDRFSDKVVMPMLNALNEEPSSINILLDSMESGFSEVAGSLVGKTISHFDIVNPIGRGGMGIVYEARDRDLNRSVALKFLPRFLGYDDVAKERFMQEARAASALDHPNIATVFEIGETEDEQLFIAMAYYHGETLKEKIDQGPLPLDTAIEYAIHLASGLNRAHDNGVIHRDVKPGNAIVTDDETVKLLDFGLAKLTGEATMTQVGQMAGTVAYMSPEQVKGQPVDGRSDIWALGVVLFEMLTGKRPFGGENAHAVIYSILNEDPEFNDNKRSRIARLILRCLEKDPDKRYQNMREVLTALELCQPKNRWEWVWSEARWRLGKSKTRKAVTMSVAATFVMATSLWFLNNYNIIGNPEIDSLAVLPFRDIGGDPGQAYFVEGMQEELIGELAKISGLRVISRQSTQKYKESDLSMPAIADELKVSGLVEGSVYRNEGRVHLRVQLIDVAPTERQIWTASFEDQVANVLTMHSDVARSIAKEIHVNLTDTDEERLELAHEVNPETYESYLQGMHFLNKPDPAEFQKGIEFFEEAVEQNPADAFAYAGLAFGYVTIGHGPSAPPDAWIKARAAAERAIRLDPTLVEAHDAMANILLYHDWDWEGFDRIYDIAYQLNPNLAFMHYHKAWRLIRFRQLEEAVVAHELARDLDPFFDLNTVWIPGLYYYAGQFEETLAAAEKIKEDYSEHPVYLFLVGLSHAHLGNELEALAALEALSENFPEWSFALGCGYALLDRLEEAESIASELEKLEDGPWKAFCLATLYASMDDLERSSPWLSHRPAHAWIGWTPADPKFESFLGEPSFLNAIEK